MELEGTWINGVIVPDSGCPVPVDGTRVRLPQVETIDPKPSGNLEPGWFWNDFGDLRGKIDDPLLPADLATQHEHYRLGSPKR